jgi:L,D-transpeptidase catalytic domain
VRLWRNATFGRSQTLLLFASSLCFAGEPTQTGVTYHLESTNALLRFSPKQRELLQKLNRADGAHLGRLRRIVVPNRWDLDQLAYSPMPASVQHLSDEPKALVVDLPTQVFGAYESGTLVRWGPVSSGGPGRQTPPGHYHLNWNARIRISSVDDSWIMPWYFNFDDVIGYGLHEYSLPGLPASHGCIRLLRSDAKWLFYWGRHGTPVLVRGHYDFGSPRPWLQPAWWSRGVRISDAEIASLP